MRILNRPMFKYGGPIKEGIMHGMKNGGTAGVGYGLVGDQRYPKTGGREHHWAFLPWLGAAMMGTGARMAGGQAIKKGVQMGSAAAGQAAKSALQGGATQTTKNVAKNVAGSWKDLGKNWFSGDPAVKSAKWGWKTLTSPTANTWAQKAAKFAISPSSIIIGGVTWYNWPDGTQRKTPPPGNMIGAGPLHGATDMIPADAKIDKKSAEELAAEAKAARTAKLEKYLDTMGYDKAKKTAMGDALIDASAIVQGATDEAGSLKKADWGKMINKAIQTTSKRLDKPEQIREAVGLMMTKADIEKDLEDPQVKELRALQIEKGKKDLKGLSIGELIPGISKGLGKTRVDAEVMKNVMSVKEPNIIATIVGKKEDLQDIKDASDFTTVEDYIVNEYKGKEGIYIIDNVVVQIDANGVPDRLY